MPIDDIVSEIVELFGSEEICGRELDSIGICELGIKYLNGRVVASWYEPSGQIRYVKINGNRSIANHHAARKIITAARKRAERLIEEDIASLDRLRDQTRRSEQ